MAFFSLAGYATFIALDVVLARHLLPGTTAGIYAAASTSGKIALFLSVAVPIVAYPRFAAHRAAGTSSRRELRLALVLVIALGVSAAAVMAIFPHTIVAILFGHRYAATSSLLRILAPEGAAMGVVGLFTYYHVAQHSIYAIVPWFGAVVVTVWMTTSHLQAHQLAVLMTASAIVASVAMAVPALWPRSARRSLGVRHEASGALTVDS